MQCNRKFYIMTLTLVAQLPRPIIYMLRSEVLKMIKITLINEAETRLLIAKKGYSLRDFSREVNISHTYISQILNGRRNPSPNTAKKLLLD